VLILGESGTGKELLARMIHRESEHPEAPFVAVNLAAIPQGAGREHAVRPREGIVHRRHSPADWKFELASGGTLFLDEIGDLRYELQAKLLRALQEHEIERIGGYAPDPHQLPADRRHQCRPAEGRQGRPLP
jgi:transcriptional regulator with GAF, ATPase, and Fis domain